MMFIGCFILLMLGIPFLLIRKPKIWKQMSVDAILVLGCPCNLDGSLSPQQRKRLDSCIHYVNQSRCDHVIVSGGAVHNSYVEAQVMADTLRSHLPNCFIETECKAQNTFQNFKYMKKQFDGEHVLIITSAAHCRRAYFFAKKFYPDAAVGRSLYKDDFMDYVIEYLRLWNVLYWEIRLRFFGS